MVRLLTLSFFLLLTQVSFAQVRCPDMMQFGAGMSAEYSGSGHGTNISVGLIALNDYKSMELGAIFSNDGSQIKGADFKYRTFVGKYNYYYGNTLIKPYVVYSCLYQMEFVFEPTILKTPTDTYIIEDKNGGTISTIEHYIGTGVMFRFLNNFYLDSNIGFGAYFGSLSKTKAPNKLGIHKQNHGYTANLKIGVGYLLR